MAPALTPEAWAQIRYDYEHTERPVADICAEHRISSGTLRDRMRRWDWTRRREPIPREGPPAVAPPLRSEAFSPPPICAANGGEGSGVGGSCAAEIAGPLPPTPLRLADASRSDPPHRFAGGGIENADADPAGIVPRLQSAVARVLPAIEATIQRLAAGPLRPREMEQTARALGTLTRTLRELNALLAQQTLGGRADDDPVPEDVDEFRFELARRIHAFIEAREAAKGEAEAPTLSVRPRESGDPEAEDSEQAAAEVPLARE